MQDRNYNTSYYRKKLDKLVAIQFMNNESDKGLSELFDKELMSIRKGRVAVKDLHLWRCDLYNLLFQVKSIDPPLKKLIAVVEDHIKYFNHLFKKHICPSLLESKET